jgi:hypothetical protein
MELPRFELEKFFQSDAAEIVAAREKAVLIHHTRDIDTAGDEVERTVRTVLRRRLPTGYYVGHGHIVDSRLATSADMDVVISDNANSPTLFRAEDGTEYFPYEALYAVGEVKSTYYRQKNYVEKFVQDLDGIRNGLQRERTPLRYLGPGVRVGSGLSVPGDEERDYRNPLFSFMLFVNSDSFVPEHLTELYEVRPDSELPNVLCFLDKGIVVNAQVNLDASNTAQELGSLNLRPEFNRDIPGVSNEWVFLPLGTEENRIGINLCFLYFALLWHLGNCRLMPPDMLAYMNRFFNYSGGRLIT